MPSLLNKVLLDLVRNVFYVVRNPDEGNGTCDIKNF